MPKPATSGNSATIALHFFYVEIAGEVWPQTVKSIGFEKAQTPLAQLGEVARVNAKTFECAPARLRRSRGHRRMDRAHVNVDRVEQQGGAVWICIKPALKRDLLEVFRLAGARLDLRLIHVLDVRLLPVVSLRADGGNIQTMRGFHV